MHCLQSRTFCLTVLGVFIARGKEDALVTLNLVPGEDVYGEKKIAVQVRCKVISYLTIKLTRMQVHSVRFYRHCSLSDSLSR